MNEQNAMVKWLYSKTGSALLFVIWTLFITSLWLPRNWGFYGNGDWDLTYSTFEVARKSITEFGQWPHFNPFLAYGNDLDANPQAAHYSIFFLPILLAGTFYGYKISIILAILIGLFGTNKLLRLIGSEPIHAVLLSLFFCSIPFLGQHIIGAGHSNFLNFYLIPALFYAYLKFLKSGQYKILSLATIILLQFISSGAPFVYIVAVLMLILWQIGLTISKQIKTKQIVLMLSTVVLSIGMGLWKLVPVMEFWSVSPRLVNDDSQINLLVWLHALNNSSTETGTPHAWHEITIGSGIIVPILIIAYRQYIPQFKIWLGLFLLVLWISIGNQPDFANPWYLIHHYFPFFNGLRAPYRFAFILVFAMLIGLAVVSNKIKDNKLIIIILLSISLTNSLSFNGLSRNLVHTPRIETINIEPSQSYTIKNAGTDFPFQFKCLQQNQFLISAYEPMHLPEVKDTLETFVVGGSLKHFTPQKITITTNDSISKLALRYSNNWSVSDGAKISNQKGLIAISSKPGTEVVLSYNNPSTEKGLLYSLPFFALFLLGFYPYRFLSMSIQAVVDL